MWQIDVFEKNVEFSNFHAAIVDEILNFPIFIFISRDGKKCFNVFFLLFSQVIKWQREKSLSDSLERDICEVFIILMKNRRRRMSEWISSVQFGEKMRKMSIDDNLLNVILFLIFNFVYSTRNKKKTERKWKTTFFDVETNINYKVVISKTIRCCCIQNNKASFVRRIWCLMSILPNINTRHILYLQKKNCLRNCKNETCERKRRVETFSRLSILTLKWNDFRLKFQMTTLNKLFDAFVVLFLIHFPLNVMLKHELKLKQNVKK